jgi:hypothetical protein
MGLGVKFKKVVGFIIQTEEVDILSQGDVKNVI